jgi:hypothetical protein
MLEPEQTCEWCGETVVIDKQVVGTTYEAFVSVTEFPRRDKSASIFEKVFRFIFPFETPDDYYHKSCFEEIRDNAKTNTKGDINQR